MKKLRTRKHRVVLSRSIGGDFGVTIFMLLLGVVMFFPMYYLIIQSLKPLDELFYFPPRMYVTNPSFENFSDLFNLLNTSWVPFSRYLFNTVFITVCGTFGNLILSSMCAYALSKLPLGSSTAYDFRYYFKAGNVGFILGYYCSGSCDAAWPLFNEAIY